MKDLKRSIWESWRGIGRNRSQFLHKKNLKEEIMLEPKTMDFIFFFFFLFYFILYF